MKQNRKAFYFKLIASILFAILVFGMYLYANIEGDIRVGEYKNILCYACIIACFIFSLLFIKKDTKKILITIALALNVVADYFLVLTLSYKTQLIGVCIFCFIQFAYALYTIYLTKNVWLKLLNLLVRIAGTIVSYFIIQHFLHLETVEIISLLYAINCFITIIVLLFYFKTEWILFFGLLLLLICDIFVGLQYGAVDILGINGWFLNVLQNYDIAFICYIPGEYLIALASVLGCKQNLENKK